MENDRKIGCVIYPFFYYLDYMKARGFSTKK